MRGNSASRPTQDDESGEIDIGRMLALFWARKWLLVAYVCVAGFLGLSYGFLAAPVYQADALLQLEEKKGNLALPAGLEGLVGGSPVTMTEVEIVRSRLVVGKAVAELHLDWDVRPRLAPVIGTALARYAVPLPEWGFLAPFARKGESIRLDYLEVPPEWVGEDLVVTVGEGPEYRLDLPGGATATGTLGETFQDAGMGFSLRIGALSAPPGRQFLLSQESESDVVTALRRALGVSEKGRQSSILELRLTSPDPERAARVLDAIAQAYVSQNIARSAAEADSSLTFVDDQLPQAERAMNAAEQALNEYRQKQQSVDLSLETEGLLTQITTLENELRGMDEQEEELKQKYTRNHPLFKQMLANRARLEDRLTQLRKEVETLPETQREVLNLSRTLEIAQQIYSQLLNRSQELRVLRASSIGNVRIVDSALTAPAPVSPRKLVILVMSLLAGAALAAGHVLLQSYLQVGVMGQEDLEKLGLPVFATINYSKSAQEPRSGRGFVSILAVREPANLTVEGFRSLRTSLHFGMLDAKTRSVAITSTAPEAGKSFTSANLAVVSAQASQNVCLIDADLRRGLLRRSFNVEKNTPGLAEVLSGQISLDEALVQGPVPGLMFLPSGRFPPNPSELLMRRDFTDLIEELDQRFDLSLFDTPPVLAVTDAIIIGRSVGAMIGVIRHVVTPVGEVIAMQRALEAGGVRLAGAVINGFDPRLVRGSRETYSYRYDYQTRAE